MAKQSGGKGHSSTASKFEYVAKHSEPKSNASSGVHLQSFSMHGRTKPMTSFVTPSNVFGSSSGLALISGPAAGLYPARMMSLQDDARSRRISGEIMKRHLYESVITTARPPRRLSVGPHTCSQYRVLPNSCSMPVTPFRGSHEVSPASTPSGSGSSGGFFRFFSRGTTPKCTTPVEEDCAMEEASSELGLAALLGRRPKRHGSVSRCNLDESMEMDAAS